MNKRLSTLLFTAFALLFALSFSSCRRAVEKARRNIRIEGVERIDRHALSGIDLTVRVQNGSRYKLVLHEAAVDIWYAGSLVGGVRLREGVEVPRHTTQSVTTRWKLRVDDPLALYALSRKLRRGDFSEIEVGFHVKGRGGPAAVNIREDRMPLSDFLRIFGADTDDLKTYLDL